VYLFHTANGVVVRALNLHVTGLIPGCRYFEQLTLDEPSRHLYPALLKLQSYSVSVLMAIFQVNLG